MKLPKEINYAEAYLTLNCNLNCPYCINDPDDRVVRKRKEMTAEEWINSLNKVDFGDIPLTLGGGEPTIHPGFFEIVQGIKPITKLDLLTNLKLDKKKFIKMINPDRFSRSDNPAYKSIRVSYHVSQMDQNEISDGVAELQSAGYSIGLFGINHPDNVSENMQMAEIARQKNIYFFVKDFLGEAHGQQYGTLAYPDATNGNPRNVRCRSKELLIAPEGNVYRCHRDLYHAENPIGHISEDVELYKFRDCSKYGECNPCDVKLKTNRFLRAGNCQVEIDG